MSLRRPLILDRLRLDGRVRADALAAEHGVSVQTIRADLRELAAEGLATRVHGGAVLPSATANLDRAARRAQAAPGKATLAALLAAEIPDGASVFLPVGTTAQAVATALCRHRDLVVATNDLAVARILSDTAEVLLSGGHLRADEGLTGPVAAATLDGFRADLAVIGCSGMGHDGAPLDYDLAEIAVARAALAGARRRVLAADATKWARTAPHRVCPLGGVDLVVTDAPPPAPFAEAAGAAGAAVRHP